MYMTVIEKLLRKKPDTFYEYLEALDKLDPFVYRIIHNLKNYKVDIEQAISELIQYYGDVKKAEEQLKHLEEALKLKKKMYMHSPIPIVLDIFLLNILFLLMFSFVFEVVIEIIESAENNSFIKGFVVTLGLWFAIIYTIIAVFSVVSNVEWYLENKKLRMEIDLELHLVEKIRRILTGSYIAKWG